MTTTLTVVVAVASIAGLGSLGAGLSAARPVEKVQLDAKYLTKNNTAKTGSLSLRAAFAITDDSAATPEPLTRVLLRFPKGAVTHGRDYPSCRIDRLTASGVNGCATQSRLGKGTATAAALPIVPKVNAAVTLFNGPTSGRNQSILIYSIPDIGPNLALQGALQKGSGTPYGYILDSKIPPIQTLPGAPNASVTSFDATVKPKPVRKSGRKIPYITGPLLCNGTFFLLDGAFSYESGLTQTVYERFTLTGGPRCP